MKPWIPALALTMALGATLLATAADLVDVIPAHQAAVQRIVDAGIITGYPDHTFRGRRPVTRYELVATVNKAIPSDTEARPGVAMILADDVASDHWAFNDLNHLNQLGLGQLLWSSGTFHGDQEATRFDLAYMATQMYHAWTPGLVTPLSTGSPFSDVGADHWAADAVREAKDLGFMNGVSADRFGGDQPIDRYQLAIVLDKLLSKVAPPPAATPLPTPEPSASPNGAAIMTVDPTTGEAVPAPTQAP